MYKNKKTIEEEFDFRFKSIHKDYNVENGYKMDVTDEVKDFIHQIRQDDLKEVKKIIKEKGLHLGYKNDILENLDNLNKE